MLVSPNSAYPLFAIHLYFQPVGKLVDVELGDGVQGSEDAHQHCHQSSLLQPGPLLSLDDADTPGHLLDGIVLWHLCSDHLLEVLIPLHLVLQPQPGILRMDHI